MGVRGQGDSAPWFDFALPILGSKQSAGANATDRYQENRFICIFPISQFTTAT